MRMSTQSCTWRRLLPILSAALSISCGRVLDNLPDLASCGTELDARPFAQARDQRFLGKVTEATARCRGGAAAVAGRETPWTDWQNYWATGSESSKAWWSTKNVRGINGALVDLEYARVELIRFNLFDNSGTYPAYAGAGGPALKTWPSMRLPPGHPNYRDVGGAGAQLCKGELIRARTLTGICNDIRNPLMGSTGALFARNVEFESTFPELGTDSISRNRHGGRTSLLIPDPQVISRKLFTRAQTDSAACNDGFGEPDFSSAAKCDYQKAPFFNVLAAFWIQFMTHDWFSHLEEGRNHPAYMPVGCASQKVANVERPLAPAEAAQLGCRPNDGIDRALVADSSRPATFGDGPNRRLARSPRVFRNTNTAWWDASQLYGFDERSRRRVKRDPVDRARLLLDARGYLPVLAPNDPMLPDWAGQEATAFPDNWSIGLSFYHNLFAREHNQFVDAFRAQQVATPGADCGLRNPANPDRIIAYREVTDDELFDVARLVVAAEIAKIHTTEWTTQLLYDEPLYRGMHSNWHGVFAADNALSNALATVVSSLGASSDPSRANTWYSVLASGPGIFGLGSTRRDWNLGNPNDVNGGINHFGSPFNFPEEFVSVYRLHPLVPDLLEYREVSSPDVIRNKIPVVATFRGKSTSLMHERGLGNWAVSMGRQRLGLLALLNSPRFLQNLSMDRLTSPTRKIDVVALDIIRDREHGVPRFNEFRRQYGLRQLTSFDDFVDRRLAPGSTERRRQAAIVATLRQVYGQHTCDARKVITTSQRNPDGTAINDCLGHPDGSLVDNIEDLDTAVGYLAETTRPHGFAISETQFVVFILNASRRLFSDRFFTSSFRPEFYSTLGVDWVNNNGPRIMLESREDNGHRNPPVSPLKRVLLRVAPELTDELSHVANAFDPWARDRGTYYSLAWKPRKGAENDAAFKP